MKGRVQGVGFRYWAQRAARRLGLRGWVRNRADGTVEVVLQGAENDVDAMLAEMGEGPRYASVASLDSESVAVDAGLGEFEIRL